MNMDQAMSNYPCSNLMTNQKSQFFLGITVYRQIYLKCRARRYVWTAASHVTKHCGPIDMMTHKYWTPQIWYRLMGKVTS